MKYNLTQELPLATVTELSAYYSYPNQPTYKTDGEHELSHNQKALLFEASQTLDKDKNPPHDISATKYIQSKSYRPYELFQYKWNYLKFSGLVGATNISGDIRDISAQDVHSSKITSTILDTKEIIATGDSDNPSRISSISATSITSQDINATLGSITNISGTEISSFENGAFDTISATGVASLIAARAKWADIAELYYGDDWYEPGTLVQFGGINELTLATDFANGCVSEKPAVVLNSAIRKYVNAVPLLLTGKTKVKVLGPIEKFDRIELSDIPGIAKKHSNKQVLGIALESNIYDDTKLVECIIKLTI